MKVENECSKVNKKVNDLLLDELKKKVNQLPNCEEKEKEKEENCSCSSSSSSSGKTDLVVLIDTSSSMYAPALQISDAAIVAIERAVKSCPTDLRVEWLGVDTKQGGTGVMPPPDDPTTPEPEFWPPGTKFTQTHEEYLVGIGAPGPFQHDAPPTTSWPHEQGADAITDLANFFDWRPGACRAIFYISDTNLDALSHSPDDDTATAIAIAAANAQDVSVFAHFLLNGPPVTVANYNDLCNNTGGQAFIGVAATAANYEELLTEVICNSCGSGCKELEMPDVHPCISIAWGDSECDGLETDDFEVLYITVCNCFSNISFRNFSIGMLAVLDESGSSVPLLPDGSPSVELHPVGPYCFGDIGPCEDGNPTCVTREFILYNKGAKEGNYQIRLFGICFDITPISARSEECFSFKLCRS